jgi:hypothetical protein
MLKQQNDSQQVLSDTLKNFQPIVAQPVAPKPETFTAVNNWQQPIQITENPPVEETQIVQPEPSKQVEQINAAPEVALTLPVEETPAMESVRAIEEVEPLDLILDENLQPVARKPSDTEQQATAPAKGSFGAIKGLFGKKPQSATDVEPEPAVEETPSVPSEPEQQPATPAKGSVGKIKNLFGKKQQPVKTEPQWTDTRADETAPSSEDQASTEEQQPDDEKAPGKLKGFYSKFRSKDK